MLTHPSVDINSGQARLQAPQAAHGVATSSGRELISGSGPLAAPGPRQLLLQGLTPLCVTTEPPFLRHGMLIQWDSLVSVTESGQTSGALCGGLSGPNVTSSISPTAASTAPALPAQLRSAPACNHPTLASTPASAASGIRCRSTCELLRPVTQKCDRCEPYSYVRAAKSASHMTSHPLSGTSSPKLLR